MRDISTWDWAETIGEFAGQPVIKHWTYGNGEVIYVAGAPNVGAYGEGANEFFDALYDWAGVSVKTSGTGYKEDGSEIFSLYKGIKEHGKGNGTINWVPQITLSPSYVPMEFNNNMFTIPEKCRVIACGELTSDEEMVVRICKNGQKLYGATVSPDFSEANHIWFDYGAEKGDKITLEIDGDKTKLMQNCNIWLVY